MTGTPAEAPGLRAESGSTPSSRRDASTLWFEHWNRESDGEPTITCASLARDLERRGYRIEGAGREVHRGENRVIRFDLADGPSIVAKIHRPGSWSRAALEEEHRFIEELHEAGVRVARPLGFSDGSSIATIEEQHYAVFPWFEGRDRTNQPLDDGEIELLGRLAAAIHRVGRQRSAPSRRSMSPLDYCEGGARYLLGCELVPGAVRTELADTATEILDLTSRCITEEGDGRVHGDLGLWNIVWTTSGPVVIDFDDMGPGPAVQDLSQLALGIAVDGARVFERLRAGYGEAMPRSAGRETFDVLYAARRIHVSAWIASRWDDPSFRRRYPDFLDTARWRRELAGMRRLLGGPVDSSDDRAAPGRSPR